MDRYAPSVITFELAITKLNSVIDSNVHQKELNLENITWYTTPLLAFLHKFPQDVGLRRLFDESEKDRLQWNRLIEQYQQVAEISRNISDFLVYSLGRAYPKVHMQVQITQHHTLH